MPNHGQLRTVLERRWNLGFPHVLGAEQAAWTTWWNRWNRERCCRAQLMQRSQSENQPSSPAQRQ